MVKVTLGLVTFALKSWLGILFLAAYVVYVWHEIRVPDTAPEKEELEPLKIRPSVAMPSLKWAALEAVLALVVIGVASYVFIGQLEAIGTALHWMPHLVALLLSPVATELPETMNALIWVRQGKERLALANISGAMMIQTTIPSALGIIFTPWRFDGPLLVLDIITALAIIFLLQLFRRGSVDGRASNGQLVVWCFPGVSGCLLPSLVGNNYVYPVSRELKGTVDLSLSERLKQLEAALATQDTEVIDSYFLYLFRRQHELSQTELPHWAVLAHTYIERFTAA